MNQETMMAGKEKLLAVLKCLGIGVDVLVDSSPFDIGRCRTARVVIPNVYISRKHCQFRLEENETWIVEDLSSSGTFLNDELVGKGNSVIIKDNDFIRLGPKDCNFIWQFEAESKLGSALKNKCCNIDFQSQTIIQIRNQKDLLKRRMFQNRVSDLKMRMEKVQLHSECLSQVKALDDKLSSDRKNFENQSDEIQFVIAKVISEEKKKVQDQMEQKLLQLQEKINENNQVEEELKLEIQKLQEKLGSEQLQWENKFLDEKRKLEEKIKEQNEKLSNESLNTGEINVVDGQELQEKLKKQEEEKTLLVEKLRELEKAKELLSQKLKESDELHLMEIAHLEKEMKQELIKKEENVKAFFQEQIDSIQKNHNESNIQIKAEIEDVNSENKQDLLLELDRVKNTLIETECRQKLLEVELAQATSRQDEASKVKSHILENIADLMETELQCSICSELFVTATTLNCTHTFCKYCIDSWKKKKKNCPICRKKITSENRSIVMDSYIDKMVDNFSEGLKSRRMAVIAERNEDIPNKKVKPAQPLFEPSNSSQSSATSLRTRTDDNGFRNGRSRTMVLRSSSKELKKLMSFHPVQFQK